MSKAILIIDVDENADFENAIADITFRDNQWGLSPMGIKHWYKGIKLKPLPRKYIKIAQISNGKVINTEDMQFMSGYNKCIDKILGNDND